MIIDFSAISLYKSTSIFKAASIYDFKITSKYFIPCEQFSTLSKLYFTQQSFIESSCILNFI